ncbi:hypothetical protein WJX72_004696 [[Myrmecia] bisecta]|uniref:Proline-rich protein PRCC n=1 Tax=[Myrmecia] bisecta TaxID=41462 RepID=A0AAW1PUC3_9CHLO
MDLLTGYGSDAASSDEEPGNFPARQAAPTAAGTRPAGGGLLRQLPAPSAGGAAGTSSLLGKLPTPVADAKRLVQFKVPLNQAALDDSDEDDQPHKKVKVSTKGGRLTDFLPAPKNSSSLGAGSAKRVEAPAPSAAPSMAAQNSSQPANFATDLSNEAFRVDTADALAATPSARGAPNGSTYGPAAGAADVYATYGPDYGGQASAEDYIQHQQTAYGPQYGAEYGAYAPQGSKSAYGSHQTCVPAAAQDSTDLLQEALTAEAEKAARRQGKDPFAMTGVKFKEIKQEKLTYIAPAAKEAMNATRTTFGPDYEAKLRGEAGPKPDKLSKRKHQISSLFHQAKLQELEQFEKRSQGMKTKAETQAKYGW